MTDQDLRRTYLRLLGSARAFVKIHNDFPDSPEIWGQAYDDLWTVVEYCQAEEDGFTGIANDVPAMKLELALKNIAEADASEPREPDDADWRWRFLEAQRVAQKALKPVSI